MLGIRGTDIDWAQKLIHVERAVTFHNNQPIIGPTKSEAGERDIPLDARLMDILEPYRKEEGYIIGDGQKQLTERTFIRMCSYGYQAKRQRRRYNHSLGKCKR